MRTRGLDTQSPREAMSSGGEEEEEEEPWSEREVELLDALVHNFGESDVLHALPPPARRGAARRVASRTTLRWFTAPRDRGAFPSFCPSSLIVAMVLIARFILEQDFEHK